MPDYSSNIFIDLGNEQSIEDWSEYLLLTPYQHENNDEKLLTRTQPYPHWWRFGGGTKEPQIGGAMAGVLKRFQWKETFGVITTHYQIWNILRKITKERLMVPCVIWQAFNAESIQLQIEIRSSLAVEIARKIGLPEEVIADASEIVGSEYINADKYLQDIVRDKRYWETKRQNIRKREKQMEETIAKYEEELQELEKSRKEILRKAKEDSSPTVNTQRTAYHCR